MSKIIGNTTATPNPRPDFKQVDETKADYIKNKPVIPGEIESTIISNDSNSAFAENSVAIGKNNRGNI